MNDPDGYISPVGTGYESANRNDSLRNRCLFYRMFHDRCSSRPEYRKAEIHFWDGPDDPENPYVIEGVQRGNLHWAGTECRRFNWSKTYKWVLTITICFMAVLVAIPAGSFSGGQLDMAEQFHVKNKPFPNMQWATMSFQIGAAVLPPFFVPLSESWGRMPGYGFGYAIYVICLFPSAFAQNFATLVVTRFFGGGAAASTINIIGGSISDVWSGSVARSRPMSLYVFAGVVGVSIGPCVGGGLKQIRIGTSWRWIFYCQIIWAVALIPIFSFILYETRGDVILAKRAKRLRQQTGRPIYTKSELEMPGAWERFKVSTTRPTRMLLTEPVVTFFTLWVSFAWGILFLFFDSVYLTFNANYKWGVFNVGLAELSILVGALIGITCSPIQDCLYQQSAKRTTQMDTPGKPIPEARLYTSIPGSLLFAGGLFWYGWGSVGHGSIHWIVPTLGIGCTGVGIYSILMTVINYLTDAYERYAASALSATSLGRNVMSGLLPLSSTALFEHLGSGWAGSLLGFVGLALSIVPVVLVLKGPSIRRRSLFMREATFD